MNKWNENNISRGTKCFGSSHGSKCDGAFPKGFLKWLKKMGWLKPNRCHLCSGLVDDPGSFKVDIRPEMNPDLVTDATKTELPDNQFDCVIVDPPYSRELAKNLYGTEKHWHSINKFAKEAGRICKSGGYVITLTYEVPKRIPDGNFIAVWGIYTIPACSYMRCLTVWEKNK